MSSPSKRGLLRLVQVGCGDIAATGHLPAIERSPAAVLTGVVDVDDTSRTLAARAHDVPEWTQLSEEVAAVADAVIVAVPPQHAPQLTMRAIELGLDVLCEKPMAVDVASAHAVRAAARANDRIVQIGFKNRFSPLVRGARTWIAEGRIGSPVAFTITVFDETLDPNDSTHVGRMQHFLQHGASFVHDGAHLSDYVAFLSGSRPTSVSASGLRSHPWLHSENFVTSVLSYANGDVARLEVGWLFETKPHGEFRAIGPHGDIVIDRSLGQATLTTRQAGRTTSEEIRLARAWNDECFDAQLDHFIACVRTRMEPETSTSAGIESLEVGTAVARAMASRETVTWQ